MKNPPSLLAYDSGDRARRARALRSAQAFSLNPQLSVHELPLKRSEATELWQHISKHAEADDRLILLINTFAERAIQIGNRITPSPNLIAIR